MDPLVELVALIRTMRIVQNLSGGARAFVVDANGAIAARNLAAAYHPHRSDAP